MNKGTIKNNRINTNSRLSKNSKINTKMLIATSIVLSIFLILSGTVSADDRTLPNRFSGTVTLDCANAPVGTVINAYIGGELRGSVTVTTAGEYAQLGVLGEGGRDNGATMTFTVGGVTAAQTVEWAVGSEPRQLNLIAANMTTYYGDADGDGYGDSANTTEAMCTPPIGYVEDNMDCDDNDPAIYPGATEVCNGIDDDCDGTVDEGLTNTYYADDDADGYGDPDDTIMACSPPAGYVANDGDCNDADATINPDAAEVNDGIDNDCDGIIDEGFCAGDLCLDLNAGWNFVSVPKRIDGANDAATVFNLDPANETCEYYDASTGSCITDPANIYVVPCQGYWVWKVNPETIYIDWAESAGSNAPPAQQLYEGWNMIGHINTGTMPIDDGTSTDFGSMASIEGKFSQIWKWTQGSGWEIYPFGLNTMTQGQGYWIWMTEDAIMSGTP